MKVIPPPVRRCSGCIDWSLSCQPCLEDDLRRQPATPQRESTLAHQPVCQNNQYLRPFGLAPPRFVRGKNLQGFANLAYQVSGFGISQAVGEPGGFIDRDRELRLVTGPIPFGLPLMAPVSAPDCAASAHAARARQLK